MRKTNTAGLLRGSDSLDERHTDEDEKIEFEEKEKVNQAKRKQGFNNLFNIKIFKQNIPF